MDAVVIYRGKHGITDTTPLGIGEQRLQFTRVEFYWVLCLLRRKLTMKFGVVTSVSESDFSDGAVEGKGSRM